jgi:hypothetical protein
VIPKRAEERVEEMVEGLAAELLEGVKWIHYSEIAQSPQSLH